MKQKHKIAYMKTALSFAECSNSKRLHVGAVLVKNNSIIAVGYNGLPAPLNGSLEDEQGNTLPCVRHAEKNALMNLLKTNNTPQGSTLFVTHSPCYLCSVDILDAGIKHVYYLYNYRKNDGLEYLLRNGVVVEQMKPEDMGRNIIPTKKGMVSLSASTYEWMKALDLSLTTVYKCMEDFSSPEEAIQFLINYWRKDNEH